MTPVVLLSPMVAFDDGPTELTAGILDVLAEHEAHAVFFVCGKNVAGREELLRRMVGEGHEVGNHGWSHRASDEMTAQELAVELGMTSDLVEEITGVRPLKFRPPFARSNLQVELVAGACGMETCPASSIGDYAMTAPEIIEAAAGIRGMLWLHDGVPATVEALPAILAART